jgi:hypothetical protein
MVVRHAGQCHGIGLASIAPTSRGGCSASWQTLNVEAASPQVCRSVGWLVYKPDCKVIVPRVTDKQSSIAACWLIPYLRSTSGSPIGLTAMSRPLIGDTQPCYPDSS